MLVIELVVTDTIVTLEHDDGRTLTLHFPERFVDILELDKERVGITVGHALVVDVTVGVHERADEFRVNIRPVPEHVVKPVIVNKVIVDVL